MSDFPTTSQDIRGFLNRLFKDAVKVADPANCVPAFLPKPPKGRTLLVAAGKAAASMARAVETVWPKDAPVSGIALTRYGHGMACDRIEVIEAAHPVPDNRGHEAAQRLMNEVAALGEDDLLLFLVSGGGSALLALPAPGISLVEKKTINKALLASGAPIGEMNCVRKHLSAIKGGRLTAQAAPAKVITLAISDVPGDDPSTIASGPTVPDITTSAEAFALLRHYNIDMPVSVETHLASEGSETPKPESPIFSDTEFQMVARPIDMIEAMVSQSKANGYVTHSLGADIEGEASSVGQHQAKMALNIAQSTKSLAPTLIISGGETTVTVDTNKPYGRGGRNCEFLLALAIGLDGHPKIHALAADSDGIDGSEDNAGAIITPNTLTRAKEVGLDPQAHLDGHDAYSFFEKLGDLIITGPTRTNVNDFRAIFIS